MGVIVSGPCIKDSLWVVADEVAPLKALTESLGIKADASNCSHTGGLRLGDYFRLLRAVSVSLGDETCHQSRRVVPVGATDFILNSLEGAASFADATRRIATAYNLMHGGAYNRVEVTQNRILYRIDDRHFPYAFSADSPQAFAAGEGLLIFVHALLKCIAGPAPETALICVRTRRPVQKNGNGFLDFWTVPVRCRSQTCTLEYDLDLAAMPLPHGREIRTLDIYAEIASMIAKREATSSRPDFLSGLRDIMTAGVTDQHEAADRMGVSVATLRRRTEASGTSFRKLCAASLNSRARTLLGAHHHPANVAQVLGFSDIRSFSRAFKAWNGVTPSQWIKNLSEIVLTD